MRARPAADSRRLLGRDPTWYRDGVLYEVHVRAFADSNGDGIGDFNGLTSRLDYLQELGITAVWLLPFYPSPLKDDGYDIADYTSVHPDYGTLRDFKVFLREAHRRGLRVITELVLNHTSDQHPWFQRARSSPPGSRWRDYYVWSDTPDRYSEARIIFRDFETSNWTWDPVAGAYYWHRFYSHQPDLNFDNPTVQQAMIRVVDFWLDMGVDGLRLDAVPYLFEREGTNCENLPETHEFLRRLRAHVDSKYEDRMLLAEANQWPEDAAAYFGDGDECHMNFHFPVMPRLFMALRMENRTPVVDILEQTPVPPGDCQWATFLRNHDELTLEMVTDEERDYMYRAYARDPEMRLNLGIRRRLAPLLDNDRRRIELLNALLFSLPGTPVLYYGDEIGMGDNVYLGDRNGVRTPMQWSPDRNGGFSRANPHKLYLPLIVEPGYHYEAVNVESQVTNPNSLLWWMRQLIALRKRNRVLGRGSIEFLEPENSHVLAFVRRLEDEPPFLVVANLSRLAQSLSLDLKEYAGSVPVEVLGGTAFHPVGEEPYLITLAPYGFFWLRLEASDRLPAGGLDEPSRLELPWPGALLARNDQLLSALVQHVRRRRWFAGKDRRLRMASVGTAVPVQSAAGDSLFVTVLNLEYTEGEPEAYVLPLVAVRGDRAAALRARRPDAVVALLGPPPGEDVPPGTEPVLVDAMADEQSVLALARLVSRRRAAHGDGVSLQGRGSASLRELLREDVPVTLLDAEQSNTSAIIGGAAIAKLLRRVQPGESPDLELTSFLAEEERFPNVPRPLGSLAFRRPGLSDSTVLLVHEHVPNDGDAWQWTLEELARFHERVSSIVGPGWPAVDELLSDEETSRQVLDGLSRHFDTIGLLGRRCAELHLALANGRSPDLRPERFTTYYQRSLYQSLRTSVRNTVNVLRRSKARLEGEASELADQLIVRRDDLISRFDPLRSRRFDATRIRIHGDLHLGQVLMAGDDVVFIDFEGEPGRPVSERRIKRSPLVDVAGVLRSFDYAATASVDALLERGRVPAGDEPGARAWSRWWRDRASRTFLDQYLERIDGAGLLPRDADDVLTLLGIYLVEKALYEVRYELANRPAWVGRPIAGVLELLEERSGEPDR